LHSNWLIYYSKVNSMISELCAVYGMSKRSLSCLCVPTGNISRSLSLHDDAYVCGRDDR